MKKLYMQIFFLLFFSIVYINSYSQIAWTKNSGVAGAGNFTISGSGSASTLNSDADIAFLKHGSGSGIYYTCNGCTINVLVTGQLVIDYPLYLTSSRLIIGKSDFSNIASSGSLFINGSMLNQQQALFLDGASSVQLESSTNFIKLQNSPTGYIYIDYTGGPNSVPIAGASRFAGTDNAPLCGLSGQNGSNSYTCSKGQINGPSILNAGGFSVISPLPVVLVDFAADLNTNKTIGLSWSTQMEVNLGHFTVQRSADGANWELLGTVQANGNSGIVSYYSFTDRNPLSGLNYYRLQMTDLDNKSGFTQVELVRTSIVKMFNVFPNPARNYVDITLSKATNGSIRLINQFGQVLQQKQISAGTTGTTISFDFFSYPAGNYFVQVTDSNGSQEMGKLLITK
jgi:hypothetical protein